MGSGREVESEWWSGMAVVHVSRLYAKGSSHFDPPPRNETAEYPCSRAAAAAASRTREPAPGHGGLEHQTSISAIQISRSGRLQCRPLIGMGADKSMCITVVQWMYFFFFSFQNDVKLTLPAPSALHCILVLGGLDFFFCNLT